MIPGEMRVKPGDLQMNVDREQITLDVSNSGDRPVQIGSHYHFLKSTMLCSLIAIRHMDFA